MQAAQESLAAARATEDADAVGETGLSRALPGLSNGLNNGFIYEPKSDSRHFLLMSLCFMVSGLSKP